MERAAEMLWMYMAQEQKPSHFEACISLGDVAVLEVDCTLTTAPQSL